MTRRATAGVEHGWLTALIRRKTLSSTLSPARHDHFGAGSVFACNECSTRLHVALRSRRARDERGQDDVGGAMTRPARFGPVLALVLGLLMSGAAWAQDAKPPEPPKDPPALTEVEALRMEVLHHRRQAMEQRLIAIRLEAEALPARIADLARQLDAVIEAAAKQAGISLKDGWRPNPETRRWLKP